MPLVGNLPHQQAAERIPNPNPNPNPGPSPGSSPRPNRNPKQAAELLTTLQNAFTNRLARPLLQNFFRCAGQICSALRRIPFMGGGASKKAAGKKEKYKNTQLAAAVLELKEP